MGRPEAAFVWRFLIQELNPCFSPARLCGLVFYLIALPPAGSMSEAAAEGRAGNSSGFVEEDATAATTDIEDNEDTQQEQVADVQITPQRSLAEAIDHWKNTPIRDRVYVTPCQKDGTWCSGCEKKDFCQDFIVRYLKSCSQRRQAVLSAWHRYHEFVPSYVKGVLIMPSAGGSRTLAVECHGFTKQDNDNDLMSTFDAFVRKIEPRYGGVKLKVSGTDSIISRLSDFRQHIADFQSFALQERKLIQACGESKANSLNIALTELSSSILTVRENVAKLAELQGTVTSTSQTQVPVRVGHVAPRAGAGNVPSAPASRYRSSGEVPAREDSSEIPPRSTNLAAQRDMASRPLAPARAPVLSSLVNAYHINQEALQRRAKAVQVQRDVERMLKDTERAAQQAETARKNANKYKLKRRRARSKGEESEVNAYNSQMEASAKAAAECAASAVEFKDKVLALIRKGEFLDPDGTFKGKVDKAHLDAVAAAETAQSYLRAPIIDNDDDDDDDVAEDHDDADDDVVPEAPEAVEGAVPSHTQSPPEVFTPGSTIGDDVTPVAPSGENAGELAGNSNSRVKSNLRKPALMKPRSKKSKR